MADYQNEVKLFMVFDVLGDTLRTGPMLWHINRERLEDVKNHVADIIIIANILKRYMPSYIDYAKITEYAICHDLPEAITGDITKFEGVSSQEKQKVTEEAIDYLTNRYGDIMDFKSIIARFDNLSDIEAKIVKMIDSAHSASTFIKYESEEHIDYDNPDIIPSLRNHPFVVERIKEGKDISEIFFEFHMQYINISDEECIRYGISREDATKIEEAIKGFLSSMYAAKQNGTLANFKSDFPENAMRFNRNK